MTYTKKQSAILGIIGLGFFLGGFVIFPNALIKGINIFTILGFAFLTISIAQPLLPRIRKLW
jgi:hypothetical protein